MPDPDLMIRPSGESFKQFPFMAISIFGWVTNIMWPDFKPQHLINAIYDFQNRERRFGGINLS